MSSELIETIRLHWIPGLVSVSRITIEGFASWVNRQKYQIYDPITAEKATLAFLDSAELVAALASDLNRFAAAAFETADGAIRSPQLPRSTAWLCIKGYYGAYYAAHALVRSLGRTYSRLDAREITSLNNIVSVYGMSHGIQLPSATYSGGLEAPADRFTIVRIAEASGGASHNSFWKFFVAEIRSLSSRILAGPGLTPQLQQASAKLDDLVTALCANNHGNGTWLSAMRNEINYRHKHGCWHPYAYKSQFADQLYRLMSKWKHDPYSLDLTSTGNADLKYFLTTCVFLIALCRELVGAIHERRSVRPVFVEGGCLKLLSLAC